MDSFLLGRPDGLFNNSGSGTCHGQEPFISLRNRKAHMANDKSEPPDSVPPTYAVGGAPNLINCPKCRVPIAPTATRCFGCGIDPATLLPELLKLRDTSRESR
jgi:hypothetical protein